MAERAGSLLPLRLLLLLVILRSFSVACSFSRFITVNRNTLTAHQARWAMRNEGEEQQAQEHDHDGIVSTPLHW